MADKLIGQDIAPPDLEAKVTGRARFAEDFRAEGMVFAKLLLSPMPHARVRRIDASRALRMPGVLGTNAPLYFGEPILALAAVDETTAADAIEQIEVDLEALPFVLDPLESLRPDGPNARVEGNTFVDGELTTVKWTDADFAAAGEDELPMGEYTSDWAVGDLDAGFSEADLVLEETIVHQSLTHHPMEPRSCMAHWQNGKLHLFGSTQSTARAHSALANMLDLEVDDVVFVGQYCGGGFGSKIASYPIMAVPALMSRQLGRPVMLRITRYEENYIGRARPAQQARVRMGWRADGKITAIDLFMVQDHGPYGASGDHQTASAVASLIYQPQAMRFRGISIYTNTRPTTTPPSGRVKAG
jgi:CO/xanthine dehydrogenase Mo-binding subunit